jgi:ribosome-binding protein aMBF1 (putative translation factor)
MAKYSTGSDENDANPNREGASCTMCGAVENLTTGEISGREVVLCQSCDRDDSSKHSSNQQSSTKSEERNDVQGQSGTDESEDGSGGYTITNPDSSWVEEDRPDYGNAETPYLRRDYAEVVEKLLDNLDITVDDIVEETGLDKNTAEAIVNGNAVSQDVTVPEVEVFEQVYDVGLQEEK